MSGAATVEVPEAALSAADHVLGDAHAKLTLLEYGDYECPACIQAEPLMQHLVDTHGGRLRLVFRHFPLVEVHPNAELAAEAAEAAAAHQAIDLALLDINLAGPTDGVALAATLKARWGVPAMFLSGDVGTVARHADAAEALLLKPYGGRDVLDAMSRWTAARR